MEGANATEQKLTVESFTLSQITRYVCRIKISRNLKYFIEGEVYMNQQMNESSLHERLLTS